MIVGRADFSEVARAHIAGEATGFLALLCERGTARVLGCQAIGEGATDLVHLGQAAIATGATADFFIEQIFNFPTMTEAYRIAAFDVLKQRSVPQAAQLKFAHAASESLGTVNVSGSHGRTQSALAATDCESGCRRIHCT